MVRVHGTTKITKAAVQEYVGELNHLRMSPATVNLALYALRKLVSELADSGLMSTESAAKVLSIKGPRRHGFACRRTTICLFKLPPGSVGESAEIAGSQ